MPTWNMASIWQGGFIASLAMRRAAHRPGRASAWLQSPLALLANEPVSSLATVMGLVDTANGIAPLAASDEVAFPNLDLTAHLFRMPAKGWLGFDTTVSFGAHGAGVTSSVLHDAEGPFGTMAQWLTVRHRG